MLTPQQKAEAEKRLKLMSSEMQYEKKIKQTIKNNIKTINDLIANLKNDPKSQKGLLLAVSTLLAPKIISFQKLSKNIELSEQMMKSDKQKTNKQRFQALEDKQRLELSIKQIKDTIKKIQETVKQSVEEESKKRQKIQTDMEKSLGDIQQKIITFDQESLQLQKQNQTLRAKKKEIQQKMAALQVDFKAKAEQKDQQVKKQKDELMEKLKALQGQMAQITEINKQFSAKQKSNFDKKLSLYLRTKKFPQYSSSFENSAKTIDQCKEQLFKGVQRMNDAKQFIQKYEKQSKEHGNTFLVELKKKAQKEAKVQEVKKQKEEVRERIISLQTKLKEKKT